eukprot:jgi/Galph1/6067/GphlegSOOS_G4738.1
MIYPRQTDTTVSTIYLDNIKCYFMCKNKSKKNELNTVIVVHGLCPSGIDDPRILGISRALALQEVICIVPTIELLKSCLLRVDSVDMIQNIILKIVSNPHLCPTGKVSIFAASISASICLIACSRPNISRIISCLCCIGPYADANILLKYIIENEELPDDYGRSVFFYNYIGLALGTCPELQQALWYRILDGHHSPSGTREELLTRYLKDKKQITEVFMLLWNDSKFRLDCCQVILKQTQGELYTLSPLSIIDRISCPRVILIHGLNDPVIPSIHSIILFEELKKNSKVQTTLCLTPLINHGDKQKINFRSIGHLWSLIRTFALFFSSINSKNGHEPESGWKE